MAKVSNIADKKRFEGCQFCGEEPDHKGYWACPRLSTVAMDVDGSWSVEFRDPELEIEFEPEPEP